MAHLLARVIDDRGNVVKSYERRAARRATSASTATEVAHVARMRIAMPAEVDTFVCDRFGDGLLVWQAAPGASLAGELKLVTSRAWPH